MDRRQFLQKLNATGISTILPMSVFSKVSTAGTKQLTPSPVVNSSPLVETDSPSWDGPKIGVVSVGGIGRNCLPRRGNPDVKFPYLLRSIAIDTYCTDFHFLNADHKVLLGKDKIPFNPYAKKALSPTVLAEITDAVAGLDMVILIAGLGGHIGMTVTPIVAEQFKKLGVLTLAIVVMPYAEEGAHRQRLAKTAVQTLRGKVDALLPVFNNDFDKYGPNWRYEGHLLPCYIDALYSNIVNPLCVPGWVNIDFDDLRDITLNQTGICIFGAGLSCGENAAQQAAVNAIEHCSFGESRLKKAKSVLFTVNHGSAVLPHDIKLAIQSISAKLASDCHFIYGISVDDCRNDMVKVNILANGIQET